ncbi:MAG TPA: ATP-binding protein [Planctomycetota bacterium]|jgi:PAS domain S-box-containing protein|nr:ATP-binding protein [Planctomycetota bacterium]
MARDEFRPTIGEGEDKLRAVVEALPDLLFVLGEDGTYLDVMSSSTGLLYAGAHEMVGRRMHEVLPRESADLFLRTVRRTLNTGKSQVLEYSLQVPAGARYFEGRTSPLQTAPGARRRIVWVSRDITERKHLEERLRAEVAKTSRAYRELKRAQAQLLRSEKFALIGMLISGVAHEINNPLNVMYGNLKLLSEAPERNPRSAGMLADALVAAERARTVMEEFRTFARDVRTAEFVDLHQCLEEALAPLRRDLPPQVDLVVKRGRIPKVRCIAHQIRQVFHNLISNAIEAIQGPGRIAVTTRTGSNQVVVDVSDTGRGIPPKFRKRLFEPFHTTKPVGRGMGLGLAISAMILHRHEGSIHYRSRSGGGSVFRLCLPTESTTAAT